MFIGKEINSVTQVMMEEGGAGQAHQPAIQWFASVQ